MCNFITQKYNLKYNLIYTIHVISSYICFMEGKHPNIANGFRRNVLLRYKAIRDVYLAHKTEDIPAIVIYRKYVYPQFYVSRSTFYEALSTPIERELKKIGYNPD